jgi:5-methylcytosine-specific restriction endonuclease McrBC regulatory subunit McrC
MLSKVFSINVVNMNVGGGSLKELDLLIFIFPRLLKEALRQGVFKQYVKREYNDANVEGTINISKHIRFNYPANGRIAYSTKEFSYDNKITQLIRHTIEYLYTLPMGHALLNGDKEIQECVRLITQSTFLYQKSNRLKVITENNKPLSHPYYTNYKALQSLCLAILKKERISHGLQNNKVHGILIDASWLWEEYVATIIKELGLSHHTSKNGFKLFKNTDTGKKFQTIIPDYVWTLNNGKNIIADAKYIPLERYDNLDVERASAIYYKTIMYMYRFATNIGYLLYPYSKEENISDTDIIDYEIDNDKDCHLYKIRLVIPECGNNYSEFKTNITENEQVFINNLQKYIK